MTHQVKVWLVGALLLVCMLGGECGAVSRVFGYHGFLKDVNGIPVNGSRTISFALYDAPTGGAELWRETRVLNVAEGIFAAVLGDASAGGNALPDSLFNRELLFLGITIGSDAEILPRQRVTSSLFSVKSWLTQE